MHIISPRHLGKPNPGRLLLDRGPLGSYQALSSLHTRHMWAPVASEHLCVCSLSPEAPGKCPGCLDH